MVRDPFDIKGTLKAIRQLLKEDGGVRVLVLRRNCEIVRMKQEQNKPFTVRVREDKCKGEECSICSRDFRCPALYQDLQTGKTILREEMCSGCGVCVDICPFHAFTREEIAQ